MKYFKRLCCLCCLSCLLFSCSEDDTTESEWDNWQQRNEAATDSWAANSAYRKIKAYTKDATITGQNADYIYVEVLESGSGTVSPLFTDTCRMAYRGRLLPTTTYSDGYVFDQTYLDDFSWQTAGMIDFVASSVVNGFCTALMNMHKGDRWRVHIPYQLGYGTASTSTIRSYSNLTFDIALLDFWHPGETRPDFKARQK